MIGGINMVVAFTGYRPEKMPFVESKKDEAYLKFRKRQLQVIERLIERGCTHFISGVAMGFDTWVAEDILVLQKNNSSLELECAIPFPGQADRWSTSDQKRRYKILTHATSSVIVCEHYSSNCFFERNKYMVNKADKVLRRSIQKNEGKGDPLQSPCGQTADNAEQDRNYPHQRQVQSTIHLEASFLHDAVQITCYAKRTEYQKRKHNTFK